MTEILFKIPNSKFNKICYNKIMNKKTSFNQESSLNDYKNYNPSFQLKNLNKQNFNQSLFVQNQNSTKKKKFFSPNFAPKKEEKSQKNLWWILSLLVFFIGIIALFGFFFLKVSSTFGKISDKPVSSESVIKSIISTIQENNDVENLKGFKEDRINILLLGMAGEKVKTGGYLTDTIMLASIDTKSLKVSLLSIPRDLLVRQNDYYTKINAVYQIGLQKDEKADLIMETIEKITGQKIHYYLTMDFEGFTKIVDSLDGINVDVKEDILDKQYPGPNYSYEIFKLEKGLQTLDGATALKYARTRHDDLQGDFGRAKRQQQTLQAMRNKIFSLETFLNPFKINEMLNTLGNHIHTNISTEEIGSFVELAKKIDSQNVSSVVIDAWQPNSLLKSTRFNSIAGLVTRTGNYSEIKELAENIFDVNLMKERKAKIEAENVDILLVNTTENDLLLARVLAFLRELGLKNVKTMNLKNVEQEKTMVVDFTESRYPFSLDEIIKKVPAEKSEKIDEVVKEKIEKNEKSIIIVLGSDIIKNYTYDEISKEESESDLKEEKQD